MRNHSRFLSFLFSGVLSVSLLAPLSSAQAAYDGSIRNLVDRVTVLTETVQAESANQDELNRLDEMQAELEDKADAKEDVSETETVTMVVTGGTINVRTGPGTDYAVADELAQGKVVKVLGTQDGWYQIGSGYIDAAYTEAATYEEALEQLYIRVVQGPLNIRSGPGSQYDIVAIAKCSFHIFIFAIEHFFNLKDDVALWGHHFDLITKQEFIFHRHFSHTLLVTFTGKFTDKLLAFRDRVAVFVILVFIVRMAT